MKTKKTKPKKKAMTLEDFATLLQTDLARMATKEDLKAIREEMATKKDLEQFATKKDLADVREEMAISFSTLGDRIVNAKDELQEQIAGLNYAKEIDELRARVQMLEQKVGIRPTRRAA